VQHLRSTVRFVDGLDAVLAEPNRVLLEVGPGRTLSTLGRIRASELGKATVCLNSLRHPKEAQSDLEYVTGVLGRLWVAGVDVDWNLRNEGEQRQRVPLPTYPWQHERHWIEPGKTRVTPTPPSLAKKPDIRDWFHYPAFKRKPLIPQPVNPTVFLLIGGDAFADELAGTLRRRGHRAIIAHSGEDFEARGPDSYRISPRSRQDLERLLATLSQDGCEPHSLVHLISLETPAAGTPQDPVDGSFSTMLALGQALGSIERTSTLELTVVTHGAKQVAGEAVLHPEHAMASAASRVLMQEVAFVSARSIDIEVRPSVEPLCVPWTLTVAEELEASPVDRNVAYRGRDRLVQSLERAGGDRTGIGLAPRTYAPRETRAGGSTRPAGSCCAAGLVSNPRRR
jgi:acyl transferase domain-containing protein